MAKKMKKVIFIAQSKGGAGKSVLTWLLSEKHPEAVIFDMDDATKTTTSQLAYRNPMSVSFLNDANIIDRTIISEFFEQLANGKKDLYICDLGASISEQLSFYMKEHGSYLADGLKELGIDLVIYTVVGGLNIFKATSNYAKELYESIEADANTFIGFKIYKNLYYRFAEEQNEALQNFADERCIPVLNFSISNDTGDTNMNRIKEVFNKGKGVAGAPTLAKGMFASAIKALITE